MESFESQLQRTERLVAITQRVGFCLWQLQELEGVAVYFYVLLGLAKPKMGIDKVSPILKTEKARTFGGTIKQLQKAGLLAPELNARFEELLRERNWLVHRSRASSRSAVHHDTHMNILVARLDKIANEAMNLLRQLRILTESASETYDVSIEEVAARTEEILRQWHGEDQKSWR